MKCERQTNPNLSRTEAFQVRVDALPPAPTGHEYKRFYGQPVLLPATGDDPIREGTGYTEKQLLVAKELQHVKFLFVHSVFLSYLDKRDARIRAEVRNAEVLKDQIID